MAMLLTLLFANTFLQTSESDLVENIYQHIYGSSEYIKFGNTYAANFIYSYLLLECILYTWIKFSYISDCR